MGKYILLRSFLTVRSGTINFPWLRELWQYFPPLPVEGFHWTVNCFSSISSQIKTHIYKHSGFLVSYFTYRATILS